MRTLALILSVLIPGCGLLDGADVRQKDFRGLQEIELKQARDNARWAPHSSARAYRLARAELGLGHRAEALEALEAYVRLGGARDPGQDGSFEALKGDGVFEAMRARTKSNGRIIRHSRKLLDLPADDLITEDLAWDAPRKRFLISSVHRRKILAVGLGGKAIDLIGPLDPALGGFFALGLDAKRDRLWASTASMEQVDGFNSANSGKSSLLCFRLSGRHLLERVEAPADGKPHALGDMTVAPDGEVFISDGRGSLFRHRFGEPGLREVAPGRFSSPQTPALDRDGKHLFLADYSLGIARVDLGDEAVVWLGAPGDLALEGIDGLYLRGHALIAVQNGTVPSRVLRLEPSPDGHSILRWSALDSGGLPEPTHGAFVNGAFCYLAGAGWERLDDAGRIRKGAPSDAPTIRRIPAASLGAWPSPSRSRPASASPGPPSR